MIYKVIEHVTETKFLGVIVDENLNWNSHITAVSLKVSRSIGVLNRVKNIMPRDVLVSLYYALIHSHITYCNIIWGGATQTVLNKLVSLQKRAIRLISGSQFLAHTSPLFSSLGILKINDIHKTQVLLFMYKYKHGLLPTSCSGFVQYNYNSAGCSLRNINEFSMPKYRLEIRKRAISILGPDLWYKLPQHIKELGSVNLFRKNLNGIYLNSYLP